MVQVYFTVDTDLFQTSEASTHCTNLQYVPHNKQGVLALKVDYSVLFGEIIAVYFL
jgi:hypothetical protein